MVDEVIKFQPGSIVILKSGSQRMTIISISTKKIARVIYSNFNNGQLIEKSIPLVALKHF